MKEEEEEEIKKKELEFSNITHKHKIEHSIPF
jgi:hypothetical protein